MDRYPRCGDIGREADGHHVLVLRVVLHTPITLICSCHFCLPHFLKYIYYDWLKETRDAKTFMTDEKITAAKKAAMAIRDLDF